MVACLGTPVENTLVDLWSLFDFAQPGLFGALNEFGKHYVRPIENEDGHRYGTVGKPASADRTSDFTPNQRRGCVIYLRKLKWKAASN